MSTGFDFYGIDTLTFDSSTSSSYYIKFDSSIIRLWASLFSWASSTEAWAIAR